MDLLASILPCIMSFSPRQVIQKVVPVVRHAADAMQPPKRLASKSQECRSLSQRAMLDDNLMMHHKT